MQQSVRPLSSSVSSHVRTWLPLKAALCRLSVLAGSLYLVVAQPHIWYCSGSALCIMLLLVGHPLQSA